jgi:hypothetical protein
MSLAKDSMVVLSLKNRMIFFSGLSIALRWWVSLASDTYNMIGKLWEIGGGMYDWDILLKAG